MSSDCDDDADADTDFLWTSASEDCSSEPDTEAKMLDNKRSASYQNEEEECKSKINKKHSSKESEVILESKDVIKLEPVITSSSKKQKKRKLKEEVVENGVDHHTQDTDNDSYLDVRVKQEKYEESKRIINGNNGDYEKASSFSDVFIKLEHKPSKKKKHKLEKLKQEEVTSEDDSYLKQRIKQERRSARDNSPSARRSPSPSRSPSPASRSSTPRRSPSQQSRSPSPRRRPSEASRSPSPRRRPSEASRSPSPRHSPSPALRSPSPRSPTPRRSPSPPPPPRSQTSSSAASDSDSDRPRSSRNNKHSSKKDASISRNTNSSHRKSNIADKIIFEDDGFEQIKDTSQWFNTKTMKKFLKQNPHVKVTNPKNKVSFKSRDEDVWLVQCPTEVSLPEIKTIEIVSEKKLLKMKVQGTSYEGSLHQDVRSVPVLLAKNENHIIKNVSLQGVINFHKRVPKTNIVQEQIAATSDSFIPLPETKCRHPLFGPNYKSASKISKAIAARLQTASNNEFEPSKKKKKHKNRKADQHEMEHPDNVLDAAPAPAPLTTPTPTPTPAPALAPPRERKRKREGRADDSDHSGAKHAKRRKHTETEPSWESEQGIEQSLFNY